MLLTSNYLLEKGTSLSSVDHIPMYNDRTPPSLTDCRITVPSSVEKDVGMMNRLNAKSLLMFAYFL